MDIKTLLEIIKLIDYRLSRSEKCYKSPLDMDFGTREYFRGKIDAYEELSHHLQEYIEGQVSAMETSTGM